MLRKTHLAVAIASAMLAHAAVAAVSADEAKQLGGDTLTVVGAEKAGNKDGSIPAFEGKAPAVPAGYNAKDPGQRPNPYANEKPLYTITAENADKYADKLDAMRELFKKYPNYRMDIYPTHRDVEYPKYVVENTLKNATSCKAVDNELKLEGCYGGFPFPIPKTGNQAMWNHLLQYVSYAYDGKSSDYVTTSDGEAVLQNKTYAFEQYDYYNPANSKPNPSNMGYWKVEQDDFAPARRVGGKLVVLDSLDMVGVGRRVYQYIPGQRRVKLAPNLAYDTPSPESGGAATIDDEKGFLGALDRYDFKLIGKKEKYIMYNNFDLSNAKACSDEKLVQNKNFPNPSCIRWELHRVWEVQATLKPNFRHVYSKRILYWDEDAPGAGSVENYDAAGKLYRITNTVAIPFYENDKGVYTDTSIELDLQTGNWVGQGLMGFQGGGWRVTSPRDERSFSPDALAGSGVD